MTTNCTWHGTPFSGAGIWWIANFDDPPAEHGLDVVVEIKVELCRTVDARLAKDDAILANGNPTSQRCTKRMRTRPAS